MQEIKIPKSIYEEMVSHSMDELPNESCGYLAGNNDEVSRLFKMTNVDASPEHFSFDPKEQFSVMKQSRSEQVSLLVVYHSHPESPARLSEEDMRLLKDPNMVYLIVSLKETKPSVKAFRIQNNAVSDLEIVIT